MANDLAQMKRNVDLIDLDRLRAIFDYDSLTGIFRWKEKPNRRIRIGSIAGSKGDGCIVLKVDGIKCCAHVVAWFYVHGTRPDRTIDHRNCDWTDNRLSNLRLAGQAMNCANRRLGKSLTGFKGVTRDKRCNRYQAKIQIGGKQYHIGSFGTAQEAHTAYFDAAKKAFGEFARAA